MPDLFGNEKIRTLGLYQPFASLMLHGKIETRMVGCKKMAPYKFSHEANWKKPPFPFGKYLIYACKEQYSRVDSHSLMGGDIFTYSQQVLTHESFSPIELPTESAICVGDLVSIIDPIPKGMEYITFVSYVEPTREKRRVGLVFINIKRIEPFPFKGKQGIGFLTDADKLKIKFI